MCVLLTTVVSLFNICRASSTFAANARYRSRGTVTGLVLLGVQLSASDKVVEMLP